MAGAACTMKWSWVYTYLVVLQISSYQIKDQNKEVLLITYCLISKWTTLLIFLQLPLPTSKFVKPNI